MLGEIASRVVTTKDYPDPSPFISGSRREETNISETLDWLSFVLMKRESLKKPSFYRSLSLSFEIDLSSVHPLFKPLSETYVTEVLLEQDIVNEMLEHDFVVRMPPRRRYTIELEVKSIKKAEPRIVEPELI
jgi:hypothetical protein